MRTTAPIASRFDVVPVRWKRIARWPAGGSVIEMRRAVVGREEEIEIAVAVEVAAGQAAGDLWRSEVGAGGGRFVAERAAAIDEQVRRLRVADVPPDVPHRLLDVAVGDHEVEVPIEIEIGKNAAEPQGIA